MLRRILMAAQALCLLPGFTIAMGMANSAPAELRSMLIATSYAATLHAAGVSLLSLRYWLGWVVVLV
ncbi:hypothetical protein EON81_26735, partial [bacterium]